MSLVDPDRNVLPPPLLVTPLILSSFKTSATKTEMHPSHAERLRALREAEPRVSGEWGSSVIMVRWAGRWVKAGEEGQQAALQLQCWKIPVQLLP